MKGLNWEHALKDVLSAAQWLKTEGKCQKVAVMGFCMGGALTIASVCNVKDIGMKNDEPIFDRHLTIRCWCLFLRST
jgi:dienelactone hydrolase